MAFIFVPNADGSFTEGDKQINPDTGVEYIYLEGAWRALGPKIEDEFGTLDNRYIKLDGTTAVSDYFRLRGPNTAGDGISTFQVIDGGLLKLYNLQTPQDSNTGWAAPVGYVQDYVQNQIDSYLPLSGGTMTGRLTIEQPRTDSNTNCFVIKGRIKNNAGDLTEGILLKSYKRQNSSTSSDYLAYYGESGGADEVLNRKTAQAEFALKSDLNDITLDNYLPLSGGTLTGTLTAMLVKSIRETGYAFEVKPNNTGDATAFIHTNGDMKAKKIKIENDLTNASARPFEIQGRLSDGSTVSKDFFYMYANSNGTASAMNYNGKMNSTNNLVNYGFVTNKVPGRFYEQNGSLYYES